jgi:hypothetical protein
VRRHISGNLETSVSALEEEKETEMTRTIWERLPTIVFPPLLKRRRICVRHHISGNLETSVSALEKEKETEMTKIIWERLTTIVSPTLFKATTNLCETPYFGKSWNISFITGSRKNKRLKWQGLSARDCRQSFSRHFLKRWWIHVGHHISGNPETSLSGPEKDKEMEIEMTENYLWEFADIDFPATF